MPRTGSLREFRERTLQETARIREHYSREVSAIQKALPKVSDVTLTSIAHMLENTDKAIEKFSGRIDEATQASNIGDFRRFAFPIITAVYPNLIANDLISIQTMKQRTAQIFWLDVVAGTDKAPYKKGDVIFTPEEAGLRRGARYSTEYIDDEQGADLEEATEIALQTEFKPIRPGTFELKVMGEGASPEIVIKDNGSSGFTTTHETITIVSETSSINYATGAVVINLANGNVTGTPEYSYEYNNEVVGAAGTAAPELDLIVRELTLKAKSQKLRTNYSWDAAYDLEMSQGIDIDKVLKEAAATQLKFDLDGLIIKDLYEGAKNVSSWDKDNKPEYISIKEHYQGFVAELHKCKNIILEETKRAAGNWVVVGTTGATVLETLGEPTYKPSGQVAVGPHFAGTVDGTLKVFKDPYLPSNAYLVGYKGDLWIDAGYVLGVYLPLFHTNVIMLDDFKGRRGYGMSVGRRMLKPQYYVRGTIITS